jgi:hypothetical protein
MKHWIKQQRKKLLVFLAHKIALPYFKWVRKDYRFPYSITSLQQMPEPSVGRALYYFFSVNQLQMLPHYEKHDIKHVVLGYPPTEEGEVCLQTFMLANGRITIPVVFSVIIGWTLMPFSWSLFRIAWQRGRRNQSLNQLNWFALIPQPLVEVRKNILITK